MAARATMAALITRLRLMVGDTAGASQVFSDQEMQDALDMHCEDWRYQGCEPLPTYSGTGIQYLTWLAEDNDDEEIRFWETDAILCDANYNTLTPSASDFMAGRFTFTEHHDSVLITGKSYEMTEAAGEIIQAWMGKVKFEYDLTADGNSLKRSQKLEHLKQLAQQYGVAGYGVGFSTLTRQDAF